MATKSAIGKMAQAAQHKLAAAMGRLSDALGVVPVDVAGIRYRDPEYEATMRLVSLAGWATEIADLVEDVAVNSASSDKLAVLRVVLQGELSAKTKAELERFAESYGLDVDASAKKDDMITHLAETLTGKRLDYVDAGDAPSDLDEALAILKHAPLPGLDGKVLRISDVEDGPDVEPLQQAIENGEGE